MDSLFFKQNRIKFSQAIGEGLAVLAGWTAMQWRGDEAQAFVQESNFWYLTGITEPDWRVIIDGRQQTTYLVSPNRSQVQQVFDGGLSHEAALAISGADEVISDDQAKQLLGKLSRNRSIVHSLGVDPLESYSDMVFNPSAHTLWQNLKRQFSVVRDCRPELTALRAIKQPDEIKAIKKAINLTVDAFNEVKSHINQYSYEYQIEADFSHHFRSRGANGHAYSPIVAAGINAVTLHYNANQDKLRKNELILMDIGANLSGYSADITRTYARGQISKRQSEVHQAVKQAEDQIIKLLKPGLDVGQYHLSVDQIMKQALIDLGLLKSVNDDETYRKYFPHAISHGLGIDVHDSLGRPTQFKPGMILTVEPGIYIAKESIGVRIEDDILITDTGYSNLSAKLSTDS